MISRNAEGGFFAAHWDWLVAAVGVAALVVGVVLFVMTGGGDPDENARVAVDRLKLAKRSETGVKPVDMSQYERALQFAVKPATISEIEDAGGNFLVSEGRLEDLPVLRRGPARAREGRGRLRRRRTARLVGGEVRA